jgi:hypothetical protein
MRRRKVIQRLFRNKKVFVVNPRGNNSDPTRIFIWEPTLTSLMLSLLIAGISAQTCSGTNNPTFNNCIRDGLVNVDGQVGATDATQACASIQTEQLRYYDCLCKRYTSVVQCFTTFCSNDPSISAYQNSQLQFCSAVEQIPAPVLPSNTAPLTPLPSVTAAPSAPSAPPRSTQTNAAMNPYLSTTLVFGEVVALAFLTNLM